METLFMPKTGLPVITVGDCKHPAQVFVIVKGQGWYQCVDCKKLVNKAKPPKR